MTELTNHGRLGIIAMKNCAALGERLEAHILAMRGETKEEKSYIIPVDLVRFSNGEGKAKLLSSVRGRDIYIITDVGNYSCTYRLFDEKDHRMGPDEHFQDLKRVLSAIGGKANRVTVIMPLLYASRQHKRNGRESMDCAMALKELENMGVSTIITFDAHDPTIHNAIPYTSFENCMATYSTLKKFITEENISNKDLTVISPDTGAMGRAIFYANALGADVGMFYKRRDYSRIVNGKNPIVEHKYLGSPLKGKSVLIVDDMIASGESVIDIIRKISHYKIEHTYVAATFAFFTEGVAKFDKLYKEGKLTKVYSTNLSYIPEEVRSKPWFEQVDLSKFLAKIVNTLSHDESISPLLDPKTKIRKLLEEKAAKNEAK